MHTTIRLRLARLANPLSRPTLRRFPGHPAGSSHGEPDNVVAPTQVLPQLPGYEVIRELGRGGMAAVYLARHTGLNRLVALKVVLAGAAATTAERLRLRREAEAVARLRHPNVVQIHDIGEHAGWLYLSLEYVGGGSIDARLAARPLPAEEAARLVEQVARAVHAAHAQGIVHRDLKPANVLLDAGGVPKVTDFGLAVRQGELHRLTEPGAIAGTPSYMAPEQVLPEPENIGPATDVYGLGTILYECLTGRPPFAAPTTLETMRQVADDEVVPVRRLQGGVPLDLETICLKCLEKDPARRYTTARELADDLARFQAGKPVWARRTGPARRVWKWARRNPALPLVAITLGMMTLSSAALMGRTTYHAYQAAGHLRERELHLHGLRGTLQRLDEAQARYAELAAATGDTGWETRHQEAALEAVRLREDAARLAPEATDAAGLTSAAGAVLARERRAFEFVRAGKAAEAWAFLQSETHSRDRERYAAAVDRFADRVDESADTELRQVQAETFWSLASATAVAGLIGATAVVGWLMYLRQNRLSNHPHALKSGGFPAGG